MTEETTVIPMKINLWERQDGETSPAWDAFRIYRDLGSERTCEKVAKDLVRSMALITGWSSRWNWVNRALAWDRFLDEHNQVAQINAIYEMRERHTKVGQMIQKKGAHALLSKRTLSASDAIKAIDLGVKIERLGMGQATEHIEQNVKYQRETMVNLVEEKKPVNIHANIIRKLSGNGDTRGVRGNGESEEMETSGPSDKDL